MADLFPSSSRIQVLTELFRGNICIIFDGFDEVSVTESQLQLNKLFVREIRDVHSEWIATHGASVPSIIFLFRSVFFEHGVFDELTSHSYHLRILYFNRQQRREYLTSYLTALDRNKFENKAASIVDKFLQGFEERLSIATTEVADAFFGHALVLSSFGDFILSLSDEGEQNVYKLANDFASETIDGAKALRILHGIESQILEREEGKFPPDFGEPLIPKFKGYPPFVQDKLLQALAYRSVFPERSGSFNLALQEAVATALAADTSFLHLNADEQHTFRVRYEEELRTRFKDHPFVTTSMGAELLFRNPVYLERYLAKHLADNPADCNAVFKKYRSASYFLALFLLDQLNWDLGDHENDLYYIIHLLSMSCNGDEYRVPIEWSEEGHWEGYVESTNVSIPRFRLGEAILVVDVPIGGVLDRVDIVGGKEQIVALTTEKSWDYGKRVSLSEVTIAAGEIEIDIPAVHFETVEFETSTLRLTDNVQSLSGYRSLTVHKWVDYKLSGSPAIIDRWREALEEAATEDGDGVLRFRRKLQQIFLWFRKHGRDNYGVYAKRFYTVATKKGRDKEAVNVTQCLLRAGILYEQESMVILNQEALKNYEIFYVQQNQLEFGDPELLRSLYNLCKAFPS